MMNDCNGGICASHAIRLIENIYSQTMHIYICVERSLSYLNSPLAEMNLLHKKRQLSGNY